MRNVPTLIGTVLLAATFIGCGGGDGGGPTDPTTTPNIAGTWNFSATLNDTQHSISCNNSGSMNLSQNGTTFTGTFNQQGTCSGPGGSFDNPATGSISGGQINGRSISFQVPFCQYNGTLGSGANPNTVSGGGNCTLIEQGITFNFTANWQASR